MCKQMDKKSIERFSHKMHGDMTVLAVFSQKYSFYEKSYENFRPQYFGFWNLDKSMIALIF